MGAVVGFKHDDFIVHRPTVLIFQRVGDPPLQSDQVPEQLASTLIPLRIFEQAALQLRLPGLFLLLRLGRPPEVLSPDTEEAEAEPAPSACCPLWAPLSPSAEPSFFSAVSACAGAARPDGSPWADQLFVLQMRRFQPEFLLLIHRPNRFSAPRLCFGVDYFSFTQVSRKLYIKTANKKNQPPERANSSSICRVLRYALRKSRVQGEMQSHFPPCPQG